MHWTCKGCMPKRRRATVSSGHWRACVWPSMASSRAGPIRSAMAARSPSFRRSVAAEIEVEMSRFELAESEIDVAGLRLALRDEHAGAFASFEGWVRDHNEGRAV